MTQQVYNGEVVLGVRLRQLRESRNRSLRQVADRSGVGRSTLSRWERGEIYPTSEDLHALLRTLGATDEERSRFCSDSTPVESESSPRRKLLRAIRRRKGLTLACAADRVGVAPATLSRWESGDRWPGRSVLAEAAEAVGGTPEEVAAIRLEGPLVRFSGEPLEVLAERVEMLRPSVSEGSSPDRDMEFIGLDATLAHFNGSDAKRLRIELRGAYVEWLAWWYRDAEAAMVAEKLLPFLRKDPTCPIWGRVVRACASHRTEVKRDHEAAYDLLSEARNVLSGTASEGLILRELAGLMVAVEEDSQALAFVEEARQVGSGTDSPDVHHYCCDMIEVAAHSSQGRHERAVRKIPTEALGDAYLVSSSAVGKARALVAAGYRESAPKHLEHALHEVSSLGLPHFTASLKRRLVETAL